MSTRLIVYKLENSVDYKVLHIIIKNEDENSQETLWGEWTAGKVFQKNTTKTPRLVVKIVTELENNNFIEIDKFAQQLNINNIHISDRISGQDITKDGFYAGRLNGVDNNDVFSKKYSNNGEKQTPEDYSEIFQMHFNKKQQSSIDTNLNINKEKNVIHVTSDLNSDLKTKLKPIMSPLEYSIEKVKENNAKIMQNIHMLNKTLNYTKKREILDLAMRAHNCESCGKCFVYESGLRKHKSMRHSAEEIPPRWQLVWTCIKCCQVWPRLDTAMEHSEQCCTSDMATCVREIKTSSLLQCEFCEKVFISIPQLHKHSNLHTTMQNYECKPCELSFSSYKNVEQHWTSCLWVKLCYSFSLQKMFLCNICEQKFKNYDQLYIHRYKIGHFTTKKVFYSQSLHTKHSNVLVYQCEICAKWFNSIPLLQLHKNSDVSKHCQIDFEGPKGFF